MNEIMAVDTRRRVIQTREGRMKAEQYMIGQFEYFRMCGYRIPDTDYRMMARVWVDQLTDYIVTYGFEVITDAVKEYVRSDESVYRQMPGPAQIMAVCKRIGKNPVAEAERRKLEKIAEDMRRDAEERAREVMSDERRKELMIRYPNLGAMIRSVYGDQ